MTEPAPNGSHEILVFTDSLAFHGPQLAELTTEANLWPNVLAAALSKGAEPTTVTSYGRRGWTARDVWFALTRDPYVYSVLLPRAGTVILAVGGMDYLPAVLPMHLREGIRLLRPPALRRAATGTFRRLQPLGARMLNGRWRNLPQSLTDHYLTRCVEGIRYFHPRTRILVTTPPPHSAASYGRVLTGHRPAVQATERWAEQHGIEVLAFHDWVAPFLGRPDMNPDGIHWSWTCHRTVGTETAAVLGVESPL